MWGLRSGVGASGQFGAHVGCWAALWCPRASHKATQPPHPCSARAVRVFCDGARAPSGSAEVWFVARGEGQEPAHLRCAPPPESQSRGSQAIGRLRSCFVRGARFAIARGGSSYLGGLSTEQCGGDRRETITWAACSGGRINILTSGLPCACCKLGIPRSWRKLPMRCGAVSCRAREQGSMQ